MNRFFCAMLAGVLLTGTIKQGAPCFYNDEENRVYACGKGGSYEIALTFDDGPHPEYTPVILDILKAYDAKATFFVIGENAERYPELVERMVQEGHTVGNHTYTHKRISAQQSPDFRDDVAKNRTLLENLSIEDRFFRPPGGECDKKVWALAKAMNYDIILWTIDTEDWKAPSKEEIIKRATQNVKGGDIVLMHDYVAGKSNTPDALVEILGQLTFQGYAFVTVDQLIEKENQ